MQTKRPATYQDVLDAPEHMVAELLDGELFLSPRPAGPHTLVASYIASDLIPPFSRGRGGPGGWLILVEPELHLAGGRVCVPELAGWRLERMATVPEEHRFTIRPDWVCEVASRSTEKLDRWRKLPAYARAGVGHAWLVHPGYRTLEVLRLVDGKWTLIDIFADDEVVHAEPFEAIELDLGGWWKQLPVRASEGYVQYGEPPY